MIVVECPSFHWVFRDHGEAVEKRYKGQSTARELLTRMCTRRHSVLEYAYERALRRTLLCSEVMHYRLQIHERRNLADSAPRFATKAIRQTRKSLLVVSRSNRTEPNRTHFSGTAPCGVPGREFLLLKIIVARASDDYVVSTF